MKGHHDQGNLRRKHLAGGLLIASEDEPMIIIVGATAAGRHGGGTKSLDPDLQAAGKKEKTGLVMDF